MKVQEPVPEQGPLQPENTYALEAGAAVKVTAFPLLIAVVFVQVPEVEAEVTVQLIPPLPVTVPLPVPTPVTVTVVELKVAPTDCAAVIVTEQAPAPVQAPLQPAKAAPAAAVGVRVTDVPWTKGALQVAPQVIPVGELVTVPDAAPVPDFVTVNAKVGAGANFAVTVTAAVPMVKLQAPVPEQAPLQPENTYALEAGAAFRVMMLPLLMAVEFVHVPEVVAELTVQLIPPVPVTVPLPVLPVAFTVIVV